MLLSVMDSGRRDGGGILAAVEPCQPALVHGALFLLLEVRVFDHTALLVHDAARELHWVTSGHGLPQHGLLDAAELGPGLLRGQCHQHVGVAARTAPLAFRLQRAQILGLAQFFQLRLDAGALAGKVGAGRAHGSRRGAGRVRVGCHRGHRRPRVQRRGVYTRAQRRLQHL
jgi:hypothetical protein